MQGRVLSPQKRRSLHQFSKTLTEIHAPYVNDRLRVRVDPKSPPRFQGVAGMEDGQIATIDERAAFIGPRPQRDCLPAQILADREEKVNLAQDRARMHLGESVADAVDIRPDPNG